MTWVEFRDLLVGLLTADTRLARRFTRQRDAARDRAEPDLD